MQVQDLFVSGQEGYHTYRIPALAVAPDGAVLAFCEARRHTGRDDDQIDILPARPLGVSRRLLGAKCSPPSFFTAMTAATLGRLEPS